MSDGAAEPAIRAAYGAAAAGFVGYAVWGSLFPFDFHAVPFSTAARLFWTRWASDAGPWSLTDLLSNVLLFLPIGLLLSAAQERSSIARSVRLQADLPGPARREPQGHSELRRRAANAGHDEEEKFTLALLTITLATLLSVVIEFGQAFVSWRTPSIVDVAAEVTGAACGVAIWRLMGDEIDRLLRALVGMVRRSTVPERVLLACCAAFAIAWLLPADFTLRPGEIADKYEHKRLLLPWMPSPDAATPVELAAIALAAVPVGLAAVVCGGAGRTRRSAANGALVAALGLAALEAIQVAVFSRTTDANELLAALGGSTAGAIAAVALERSRITRIERRALRLTAAVVLWICAVVVFEWWPFKIAADGSRMQLETIVWSRAPFRWPSTASDVVPGAVLAAIAGAYMRPRLDPRFQKLQTMLLIGSAAVVFAVCEAGRVALEGGRPTLLSVVVKLSALLVGLYLGSEMTGDRLRGREAH